MVFGNCDKLFWDSATKMMLSSIIILISISISIGLPVQTPTIAEEIQHLNCSLTNRFFVEKLRLNSICKLPVVEESHYEETTSFSLELCMAYLDLNKDLCNSGTTRYRSSFYDESTNFVIRDISQYNDTQVDDFLQGLNKKMKDVNTFCKNLHDFEKQLEPHKWVKKLIVNNLWLASDCEIWCADSNGVKDVCSVLLWARTLKAEQSILETNKNYSYIDSKQQSSTEVLKPPSRTADDELTLIQPANRVAASGPSRQPLPSSEGHPVASNVSTSDSKPASPVLSQKADTADNADEQKLLSTSSNNAGNIDNRDDNRNNNRDDNTNNNRDETIKDNRYESVDAERLSEGKSNVDVDKGANDGNADDDGKELPKAPAEFEDNEPQLAPAKGGAADEQPESNVMSIKDRNDEAAAAAGQLDSNFNEQQQLLTVQDKQAASVIDPNNDDNAANNDDIGDGPADEDGDDLNPSDIGAQEAPAKQAAADSGVGLEQMSVVARGNMDPIGSDESHFYSYFVSMGAILVLLYLMLHYKKKLVALAVEGRRGRSHGSGRRRPNTASYSKLDSNLEEAMASNMSQASVTHVLY